MQDLDFDLLLARLIALNPLSTTIRFRAAPENYYSCEVDNGLTVHCAIARTLYGALSLAAERSGLK